MGYSPACHKGSTISWAPVAAAQVGGSSPVLNLLCAKYQATENWEHRSGIQQIFWQVMKDFPQHIFPTTFSSCPSAPLCIYATAYKIEQVILPFETVYLRLGLKPTWRGFCTMLSHSVITDWDLSPTKTMVPGFRT